MQLTLFQDTTTNKTIIRVPIERLRVSQYNPRSMRPDADVETLAERMQRNGFEITRALWATRNHDGYEVFAGGTRLAAARAAGLSEVPIVLHEGFTDEQIVGLADEDNENDEYHRPVSVVDMWLSCKALIDHGWEPKRIADAKKITLSRVSEYKSYADFPQVVLDRFSKSTQLTHSHAAEISKISNLENLSDWLPRDLALTETIDTVLSKIAKSQTPTAKQFESAVSDLNAVIRMADELYRGLYQPEEAETYRRRWCSKFLSQLVDTNARTRAEVQSAFNEINRQKLSEARRAEEELARQQSEAEAERLRLEREAERAALVEQALAKIVRGDARTAIHQAPSAIKLVLTDPPYGKDYQSNRRVTSAKAPKIANDDGSAFALVSDVLRTAYDHMADDSTILLWTDWKHEPDFRAIVEGTGFTIKGSLIWNKPNHGTGDIEGSFAPKHERIIHAVKGAPKLRKRLDDVLEGTEFLGTDHPMEKPVDLLRALIEATTDEGDIVADPFAGVGSTVMAAFDTRRDYWACELDKRWHQIATDTLYARMEA